jgi:integrase
MHPDDFLSLDEWHALLKPAQSTREAALLWLLGGAGLQETRKGNVRLRKWITPHLLRHSFSRWSLDAGIDISYLQQQLGHSSLSTRAVYLQARPNYRRKAYEKAGLDQLLTLY